MDSNKFFPECRRNIAIRSEAIPFRLEAIAWFWFQNAWFRRCVVSSLLLPSGKEFLGSPDRAGRSVSVSPNMPKLGKLLLVAFLFLVVRPGAPSSVLAPSSDALCS